MIYSYKFYHLSINIQFLVEKYRQSIEMWAVKCSDSLIENTDLYFIKGTSTPTQYFTSIDEPTHGNVFNKFSRDFNVAGGS